MGNTDFDEKINAVSAKIIDTSRNVIFLNLRYFTKSVNMLVPAVYKGSYATDGKRLFYDPSYLIQRYKTAERLPVHDILHLVLHCVFRHWFINAGMDKKRWDAACDIAVESLIAELDGSFFANEKQNEKNAVIYKLSAFMHPLTAEKVYAYLKNVDDAAVDEYSDIFSTDDHKSWYKPEKREYEPEEKQDTIGLPSKKGGKADDEEDAKDGFENGFKEKDGIRAKQEALKQLEKLWRETAKQILTELDIFQKKAGDRSDNMIQALEEVNRERYDYTAFLRKFAVMGETMRLDSENFDINFYSYGMSLYGNTALIEPLEYKEEKRIRDFVIALDTSGSVSGAAVQSFVQKTYNILCSENSFFKKVNIHIIQCDTQIRETVKITCRSEFEDYFNNMEVHGLGGTDFRPVFDYVNELIAEKEFDNLKGLIYFTDGFGEFPAKKPAYETAFVFMQNGFGAARPPEVPPWAIKVVLEEGDI